MRKEELLNTLDKLIKDEKDLEILFLKYVDVDISAEMKEKYKKRLFPIEYQTWYSKSLEIIKVFLNDRLQEFINQYEPVKNRKALSLLNYTIYDAIMGVSYSTATPKSAYMKLMVQFEILSSVRDVIDEEINEITSMLEFDVFEKELDSAKH